MLRP
ncbi:hypothetical protein YPPY89_1074, partial [Yersinia pestis PY-89]|jgi:acetolactate synthase-1/2/3 large subunit